MPKTIKSQTVNQWFDSFLLVAGGKSLIMVNRPDMISIIRGEPAQIEYRAKLVEDVTGLSSRTAISRGKQSDIELALSAVLLRNKV